MTALARGVLFVSSFAPLLVLFWILESFGPGWPGYICLAIAAVGVVALIFIWWYLRNRRGTDLVRVEGARNKDSDVVNYVVSYVVPFAAATSGDTATKIGLVVFAVLIAVLYIRSAVFYVHPLLLLAGIHVYDATVGGMSVTVLSRRRHMPQDVRLRAATIGDLSVYVEVDR